MVVARHFEQAQKNSFGLAVAMVFVFPQDPQKSVQRDQQFPLFRHAKSIFTKEKHVLFNNVTIDFIHRK